MEGRKREREGGASLFLFSGSTGSANTIIVINDVSVEPRNREETDGRRPSATGFSSPGFLTVAPFPVARRRVGRSSVSGRSEKQAVRAKRPSNTEAKQ